MKMLEHTAPASSSTYRTHLLTSLQTLSGSISVTALRLYNRRSTARHRSQWPIR